MRILNGISARLAVLASLFLLEGFAAAAPAHADTYAVARVSYTNGDVAVQAAKSTESSNVAVNMPIEPGDRVMTGDTGRAAFQLPDSSIVRVGADSTLDFTSMPAYNSDTLTTPVVRLSSGSAYVETGEAESQNPVMEVVTPSATVNLLTQGTYGVDVDRDKTARVIVISGQADVEGQSGSVTVDTGQTTRINYGEAPEQVTAINANDQDAFARWNQERDTVYATTESTEVPDDIPGVVEPYYHELARYGTWAYDRDRHVRIWRPRASIGWRPYWDGYWDDGPSGPVWVSSEPWGWAPYHFGRWSFDVSLGWGWTPGAVWGPAWVDWDIGPDFIGWCPLDYYGYPVSTFGLGFGLGRGEFFAGANFSVDPRCWTFVGHHDFFDRHLRSRAFSSTRVASLQPGVLDPRLPLLDRRDPAVTLRATYQHGLTSNAFLMGSRAHPAPARIARAALRPAGNEGTRSQAAFARFRQSGNEHASDSTGQRPALSASSETGRAAGNQPTVPDVVGSGSALLCSTLFHTSQLCTRHRPCTRSTRRRRQSA